jgi:hypothetical protein
VIGSSNAERNSLFPGEGGISEEYAMTRLPETPSLQNLGEIASVLAESTLFQQEAIAQHLLQPGYLKGVLDAFGMAEDLEDEEGLKAAHMVVKGAIMLNDVNLLEALFSDEFVVAVVGALEYDALLSMSPQGSELSTASEATAVSELRGPVPELCAGGHEPQGGGADHRCDVPVQDYPGAQDHVCARYGAAQGSGRLDILDAVEHVPVQHRRGVAGAAPGPGVLQEIVRSDTPGGAGFGGLA